MKAKDFREIARNSLKGNWDVAVVTTLVASILGVFGFGTPSSGDDGITEKVTNLDWLREFFRTRIGTIVLVALGVIILIASIWSIIHFIIGGALRLGYSQFTLNIVDGKEAKFKDLFCKMNIFSKGFVLQLLKTIFTILWTMLFIVPGIIKAYSYSMAEYILAENEGMSAKEAINASKELMKGNKWRLFCMELSFIGWDILCVFTLGIGSLWLEPYKQVSHAAFFRVIYDEKYPAPTPETVEGTLEM